jgi:transcriptional regulator with XRE-family HTH domain
VQFRTNNNLCRRCKLSLDSIEEVAAPEPVPAEAPACSGQLQIASAIRTLRQRSGLSQRQLAMRMQVPRTYVSKIENDKATPTLSSLSRLAIALGVTVPALLECSTNDGARNKQIEELMADSFLAELAPFVCKLDAMQRSSFIAQVRDLATRPRRTA